VTKYRIKYADTRHEYGKTPEYKTTTVEAHTFKVNDQGTVLFTDRAGAAIASFKTWVSIKPVEEAKKAIRINEVTITAPDHPARLLSRPAGPYDHPVAAPYDR